MRKNFNYPVIAAFILIFSILLLPNVEAARASSKLTAINNLSLPEDGFADLGVTKVVDPEQAIAGMNVTYTITVQNFEPINVDNVTLNDPLPAGMTFVSLSKPDAWTCTTPTAGQGGIVNCTNPSLAANANDVFTLVVNIPANTDPGTSFTNIATVSSTTPDPNDENNSAPATTTVMVRSPDLQVTKVADPEQVNPGENLTYTITVHNGEAYNADNATLDDPLPAGTTFVSLSKPAAWTCTTPLVGDGGTVNCTNPSFAANSDDVFILVVKVPDNAQATDSFTNTATISSTMPDSNEENNSATVTTTIATADLEVTKTDNPDPGSAGSNLTYTITVINNGPESAANATLSDTLPAGTTFVSLSSPTGWTCTKPAVGSGGTVNCSTNSFAVESAVFILVVKVDSSVSDGTIITNTATASSTTPDSFQGNNTGTATTPILNLRAWTTAGDSSVTEDESNPARPTYTNFTAAAGAGSPAGAYTLRYNIQATNGLSGPGSNTRLRVRFRDEGEGSRVIVAIVRSPLSGGAPTTLGTIFDSDEYTPNGGFQTQEIIMPALVFDFTQNVYWLEVRMTKDSTSNQPGFGSAQINKQ